jgi:hypothetical protein
MTTLTYDFSGLLVHSYDDELRDTVDRAQSVHGAFNKPRSILDLYTPRFVKGVGVDKVGMCPVWLVESPLRVTSRAWFWRADEG